MDDLERTTRRSLQDAKDAARLGMAAITAAMEDALAKGRLGQFYREQIQRGEAEMAKAEAEGNPAAQAQAAALVADMKARSA